MKIKRRPEYHRSYKEDNHPSLELGYPKSANLSFAGQ